MCDIKDVYTHLEKHTGDPELRNALIRDQNDPLFLNAVDCWTWRSAVQLYMCFDNDFDNARDIPNKNYWAVRSFLAPYKKLLRLAGVGEIKAARIQDMPASLREDDLINTSGVFNDLRVSKKLTDVFFVAKYDDDKVREIPAHRVFLASRSKYFRALFCGGYGDSSQDKITVECQYDCLEATLGQWRSPRIRAHPELTRVQNTCTLGKYPKSTT